MIKTKMESFSTKSSLKICLERKERNEAFWFLAKESVLKCKLKLFTV